MSDLRVIFMGTPEFAVPSLEILIKNNINVVAVVTAPDKPKGRGQKLTTSPVKDCAIAHNIPVLQPTNLKSEEFLEELKSYQCNLQVVVAFRMLPEVVWSMPPQGTFNLHSSLLPQYRGAAPINWAIINGEKETGVTTFLLKHEIDTGNIILQEKEPIHDNDNVGSLYERLMKKGAELVLQTANLIADGNVKTTPQANDIEIKHAPKIFKQDCQIDWNKSAEEVYNFIRGLSPYPAAWTTIDDKTCKIYKAIPLESENNIKVGALKSDNKNFLHIMSSDKWLSIEELQLEGKKRMNIKDFLRGYNITQPS